MNIAFSCYLQLNELEKCLEILIDSAQLPEACLFCRTYLPSKLAETMDLWNIKINDSNSNNRLSKYFLNVLIIIDIKVINPIESNSISKLSDLERTIKHFYNLAEEQPMSKEVNLALFQDLDLEIEFENGKGINLFHLLNLDESI